MIHRNTSNDFGMKCVTWTARYGTVDELCDALNDSFSDTHLSDMDAECTTLLLQTVTQKTPDVLECLLKYCEDSYLHRHYGRDGKSFLTKLLCHAVEAGDQQTVEVLAARGGDLNCFYHGKPLLHSALDHGHVDAARILVERGTDMDLVSRRGEGVVAAAIQSQIPNKADVVQWLIKQGADPRQKSTTGKLPIHVAAAHAPDVINVLCALGHDVNETDAVRGDTPLHIACGACCRESITKLIQCGAQFNCVNNQGETPLGKLLKFAEDFHDFHSKTRIQIAKTLIRIGFRIHVNKPSCQTGNRKGRNKLNDVYCYLMKSRPEVTSLQGLCCPVVRELCSGHGFRKQVDTLAIPNHLKSYVMLTDTYKEL